MNAKHLAGILTFLFVFVVGVPTSVASDKSDIMDAVQRYLAYLDPDKLPSALAMCASQVSILDEFPPHE